jgi:hypothetical protein
LFGVNKTIWGQKEEDISCDGVQCTFGTCAVLTGSAALTRPGPDTLFGISLFTRRFAGAKKEVLHGDQATTSQTDRRNERVQQTRQGDCHQPPLKKGWKETNALDDTPDWVNCTLLGHSTSTCRCVRPLAAPPMLPTKSTTGRTVTPLLEEPFRLRRKERKEARHMLHPKTTLQWPATQHEQARTKPQ